MSILRLLRAGVRGASGMINGESHSFLSCVLSSAGTSGNIAPGLLALGRHLHTSQPVRAVDVKVPSMGDSITEGSVATLMRQTGDLVEEDEPILQIETDKVTIDVRAPMRGILRALTVKEQDTVIVGAVIAVLDEQEGTSTANAIPPKKPVDLDELTAAASEVSDSKLRGHKARISFPPRRTADGSVISSMPAVDQQTYIARSTSAAPAVPAAIGAGASAAGMLQATSAAAAEYVARRTLDEKEMEYIMLGGAEP